MPGNLGLEDVRVALGWVQQNIGDFGGDPGKVTLAGHGQGATIAHLLALNPTTSVLFSKMILASGSALCEGSLNSPTLSYSSSSNANSPYVSSSSTSSTSATMPELLHPYYTYKKVLAETKCSSLRCLQEKPVQELIKAQETIEKDHVTMTTLFTPTIDVDLRSNRWCQEILGSWNRLAQGSPSSLERPETKALRLLWLIPPRIPP